MCQGFCSFCYTFFMVARTKNIFSNILTRYSYYYSERTSFLFCDICRFYFVVYHKGTASLSQSSFMEVLQKLFRLSCHVQSTGSTFLLYLSLYTVRIKGKIVSAHSNTLCWHLLISGKGFVLHFLLFLVWLICNERNEVINQSDWEDKELFELHFNLWS